MSYVAVLFLQPSPSRHSKVARCRVRSGSLLTEERGFLRSWGRDVCKNPLDETNSWPIFSVTAQWHCSYLL